MECNIRTKIEHFLKDSNLKYIHTSPNLLQQLNIYLHITKSINQNLVQHIFIKYFIQTLFTQFQTHF